MKHIELHTCESIPHPFAGKQFLGSATATTEISSSPTHIMLTGDRSDALFTVCYSGVQPPDHTHLYKWSKTNSKYVACMDNPRMSLTELDNRAREVGLSIKVNSAGEIVLSDHRLPVSPQNCPAGVKKHLKGILLTILKEHSLSQPPARLGPDIILDDKRKTDTTRDGTTVHALASLRANAIGNTELDAIGDENLLRYAWTADGRHRDQPAIDLERLIAALVARKEVAAACPGVQWNRLHSLTVTPQVGTDGEPVSSLQVIKDTYLSYTCIGTRLCSWPQDNRHSVSIVDVRNLLPTLLRRFEDRLMGELVTTGLHLSCASEGLPGFIKLSVYVIGKNGSRVKRAVGDGFLAILPDDKHIEIEANLDLSGDPATARAQKKLVRDILTGTKT